MGPVQSTLFAEARRGTTRRAAAADAPPEWAPITTGSVLLSIDPSIARTGHALLLKTDRDPIRLTSGIIYPRGTSETSRFDDLAAQVTAKATETVRFNGVDYKATAAVVEVPSGGQRDQRSASQLMTYARAVGVCEAACYFAGLNPNRVPVQTWKGNQAKARTFAVVKALFSYEPSDANEADSLGLGLFLCSLPCKGQRR